MKLADIKVLVNCEQSGHVRDAFARLGFDAWSCDLQPTRQPGQHIIGDAIEVSRRPGWHLMIAHPPCKYIAISGNRHRDIPSRAELRKEAIDFFFALWQAPIPHICLENPIGYIHSILPPTQTIHPYFFGERQMKRTSLWLKGLPPLTHWPHSTLFGPATHTQPPEPKYRDKSGKNRHFTESIAGNSREAEYRRAVTFQAIADAMAAQWGDHLIYKYIDT